MSNIALKLGKEKAGKVVADNDIQIIQNSQIDTLLGIKYLGE